MKTSMLASLCAATLSLAGGAASAADVPHAQPLQHEVLPPLYVAASIAQAACPTDQIVWVNWSARTSHRPDDYWYGRTVTGAYACAGPAAEAGIKPAH